MPSCLCFLLQKLHIGITDPRALRNSVAVVRQQYWYRDSVEDLIKTRIFVKQAIQLIGVRPRRVNLSNNRDKLAPEVVRLQMESQLTVTVAVSPAVTCLLYKGKTLTVTYNPTSSYAFLLYKG